MKKLSIWYLAIFFLATTGGATAKQPQKHSAQQISEYVSALISNNDFYALERLTPQEHAALPPLLRHLTDAAVGSRFNELPRSCKAIETLLNNHNSELDSTTQGWLLNMLLGNLRILSEYGSAAQIASMLEQGAGDSVTRQVINGLSRWFGALSQYPRTTICRPAGDVTLPLHVVTEQIRDALGEPTQIRMLYTDVEIGGQNERFIFDTGCSHGSFVSQEFADRHGIRIICDSILASGAAATAYARAGILDSMRIGPITVYHPTFIITPPNESIDTLFKVHAVLGTDFMNLVGEVQLYPQRGQIIIPAEQTPMPASGRNLSLDTGSGLYSLQATCGGEAVTMVFDTGSARSSMTRSWFESHRAQVETAGKYKEMGVGGFGGTTRGYGYEMPSLLFRVGEHTTALSDIRIYSDIDVQSDRHEGCLGADFILSLDKAVFNFSRMFVTAN